MLGGLATFGYSDKHTEEELQNVLIANKKALLVDTRLNPTCSWSLLWTRRSLVSRYGSRYVWCGDLLGNKNYRDPHAPIELADESQGIAWLVRGLTSGYTLILLCGCHNYNQCHRKHIYDLVKENLQDRLPEFSSGQRVLTPCGVGRIDLAIPLDVHRARNRYAVVLDIPTQERYFFPGELEPFDVVQASLIA